MLGAILGYQGGGVPTAHGADPREGNFCSARLAKDYLQPLSRMAPITRVPGSGKLPFGPSGLRLEARGGRLVVGPGLVGFGISDEAVGQVRRLNWDLSLRLVKVDARGGQLAIRGVKRRRIGSVRGNQNHELLLPVSGSPGYFRVDIAFRHSRSRRFLGEFSNYVRVVRPRVDARLLLSAPVVHRGEAISARLANFGTENLWSGSPDWGFSVQRFEGADWIALPAGLPSRRKPLIQTLPAGRMSQCMSIRVSEFERPGLYRVSAVANRSRPPHPNRRAVVASAQFEISGRVRK